MVTYDGSIGQGSGNRLVFLRLEEDEVIHLG